MIGKRYTMLGWVVWQIARRVALRKVRQQRTKMIAAVAVVAVLVAGAAAARGGGED